MRTTTGIKKKINFRVKNTKNEMNNEKKNRPIKAEVIYAEYLGGSCQITCSFAESTFEISFTIF